MLTRIRAKQMRNRIAKLLESAATELPTSQYLALLGELHCVCMILGDSESKRIYKMVAATAR